MGVPGYITAPDSTPISSETNRWIIGTGVAVIIGIAFYMFDKLRGSAWFIKKYRLLKRDNRYLRETISSLQDENLALSEERDAALEVRDWAEQALANANVPALEADTTENKLRVSILEKQLLIEETRQKAIGKLLLTAIAAARSLNETGIIRGTFQEFRGDSLIPEDIVDSIDRALTDRDAELAKSLLAIDPPDGDKKDPE